MTCPLKFQPDANMAYSTKAYILKKAEPA